MPCESPPFFEHISFYRTTIVVYSVCIFADLQKIRHIIDSSLYDRVTHIGQPIARLETSYASSGTVGTVAFIKSKDMKATICF